MEKDCTTDKLFTLSFSSLIFGGNAYNRSSIISFLYILLIQR